MKRAVRFCFSRKSILCSSCAGIVNVDAGDGSRERGDGSTSGVAVERYTLLPAVNRALPLFNPCQEFPATPVGVELPDPRDPCVVWREYYSFEHRRPYYHNLLTNLTTFEVPSGLRTCFSLFHRRQGLYVDKENRVHHRATVQGGGTPDTGSPGASDGVGGSPASPGGDGTLTTKQKLAAYGGGGLLLYIIVHNILLAAIFFSLYFLHVDLVGIARSYGFSVGDNPVGSGNGADAAVKKKKAPSFWATLGVSIVLNKLLVPLELAATLMLAPVLVPRLQPFATRLIPSVKAFIERLKGRAF
ncbi:hypothetical protein MOQ_004797 [Trypanosoma cruzi marinkellei]|uniref:WW domain-containing protein n=1 Tax=Trypanosoma cruzi marinkellei TaxID=85056 RepID=K2NR17_TRYCR|nr:hypothetical protein MOQ_004797 [Trypanosoma cruzi marinkellei]